LFFFGLFPRAKARGFYREAFGFCGYFFQVISFSFRLIPGFRREVFGFRLSFSVFILSGFARLSRRRMPLSNGILLFSR
jgi:hypothetical protein